MKGKKKILGVILSLSVLTVCFIVLCYVLPAFLDKQDEAPTPYEGERLEVLDEARMAAEASLEDGREQKPGGETETLPGNVAGSIKKESTEGQGDVLTESSVESTVESVTESSAENTVESTAESTAEKSTESVSESTAESVSESKPAETESKAEDQSEASGQGSEEQKENGVQDRQAPVFLSFSGSPQINDGSEFDVHKYVGYGDDVDRNVDLTVSGEVDTGKVGTYPIKITLSDDAGHTTSKNLNVQVVNSISSGDSGGSGKKENFSDFVAKYKTDETSLGIDISRWQETVDFERVKAAGCEFVYMRLGGYDDGELYTDRYYKANLAGAKAAGLRIGIYWHAEESSPEEVKASVAYLMNVLGGEKLDFPIAYDWEDYKNFERYGMNLQDLNDCFTNFEKEVEAKGYCACLYGSKSFLENVWTKERKNPSWLAHYTSATSYTGAYFMWQHGCTGRIDGISGDVDLDILYDAKAVFQSGQ